MKKLTQSMLTDFLEYNFDSGVLSWKVNRGPVRAGDKAGYLRSDGYISIALYGTDYQAHRLAWFIVKGAWPNKIDHINHVRSDNRWVNFRNVSNADNSHNLSKSKNNSSGVVGVVWDKRSLKWQAQISHKYKRMHLGLYVNWFDAVCARKSANNKYGFHVNHGRCF